MLEINHSMKENRDYFIDRDGYAWLSTSQASKQLKIDHITLNRDCKIAIEENKGNLANLTEYISMYYTDSGNARRWFVRHDITEVYTLRTPGKGRDNSWFFVRHLQTGDRPCDV